jgi:hypothetical protein
MVLEHHAPQRFRSLPQLRRHMTWRCSIVCLSFDEAEVVPLETILSDFLFHARFFFKKFHRLFSRMDT